LLVDSSSKTDPQEHKFADDFSQLSGEPESDSAEADPIRHKELSLQLELNDLTAELRNSSDKSVMFGSSTLTHESEPKDGGKYDAFNIREIIP